MATVTRIIESKFHGRQTEVEAPKGLTPGALVSWLQDNAPEALDRVCPYDDCWCEIDEWDEGLD
jgi:hypothetical protein